MIWMCLVLLCHTLVLIRWCIHTYTFANISITGFRGDKYKCKNFFMPQIKWRWKIHSCLLCRAQWNAIHLIASCNAKLIKVSTRFKMKQSFALIRYNIRSVHSPLHGFQTAAIARQKWEKFRIENKFVWFVLIGFGISGAILYYEIIMKRQLLCLCTVRSCIRCIRSLLPPSLFICILWLKIFN